jgi:hypothetical protein
MKTLLARGLECIVVIGMMAFLQSCGNVEHPRSPEVKSEIMAAPAQDVGPGIGGGGGDYDKDQKPTPEQVREAITVARQIVPFVLNHLEGVITDARAVGAAQYLRARTAPDAGIPLGTYGLLFPWPRTSTDAQSKWSEITLRIEPQKPCYDDRGNEKAASALPLVSNEICLSIPKIGAGAVRVNIVQRVVALLIHELSHKMGVEDHVILEKSLLAMLPPDPSLVLKEPLRQLRQSLGAPNVGLLDVVGQTLKLLTGANRDDIAWPSVCYGLATIAAATQSFAEPDVLNGVSLALLRPEIEAEKQAVHLRAQVFSSYCVKNSQAELLRALFQNRLSKPINLGGSGVLSIARGTFRKPVFRDPALLTAELQDVKTSLLQVRTAVR